MGLTHIFEQMDALKLNPLVTLAVIGTSSTGKSSVVRKGLANYNLSDSALSHAPGKPSIRCEYGNWIPVPQELNTWQIADERVEYPLRLIQKGLSLPSRLTFLRKRQSYHPSLQTHHHWMAS